MGGPHRDAARVLPTIRVPPAIWVPPRELECSPARHSPAHTPCPQVAQTVRKIAQIDDHICLAFAGLTADARVLINKARIEAQSHRLTLDERASVEHMTRCGGWGGVGARGAGAGPVWDGWVLAMEVCTRSPWHGLCWRRVRTTLAHTTLCPSV